MGFLRNSLIIQSFLLALSFPALANWASEEPQTRKHIVRPQETLEVIADSYGFEANELAAYNQLDATHRLRVGQVIYFPTEIMEKQPDYTFTSQDQPLDARHFSDNQDQPLDARSFSANQNRSLNVRNFPNQVKTYVYERSAGGVDSDSMSGKESDVSNYTSPVHYAASPEYDYNFARKTSPQTVMSDAPKISSQAMMSDDRNNYMIGQPPLDSNGVISAENAIEFALDDFKKEEIEDEDSPALAAFGDRPYAYFGNGDSLPDVLQNFAGSYYMPVNIAETVQGLVNGKIGPMTPVDFLDHLANIYGFIWYFDGHTLFVYDGGASSQQIISLSYLSVSQFKDSLKKIGIWDGRFFWKEQPNEGLIFISGPPRYTEMISQTALLLDAKEGERQKSKLTVRTFPLKYAWATDKSFSFRGQQLTVPGVATILTRIIKGGGIAQVTRQGMANPPMNPMESVTKSGEAQPAQQAEDGMAPLNAGAVVEDVYINADPRLNAIIVHDLESKMPMYAELIASLDKPTSQIEISVSIIDINTQDLRELGVEWNSDSGTGDTDFSFDPTTGYTTIVSSALGSFTAQLKMLADEGRVKIVSRPSILTLDNIEAVLDNSSTFYVKVESNEDAELFPVTSGTVVQVTPRIVREDTGRRIHMSVNIQDGTGSQGSDNESQKLPATTNSSINTQAIISEQESLLIGGFYKEQDEEKTSKIPVLGDIPVLGHIFRSESTSKIKQVRLFLITPRIVGSTET